MQPCDIGLHDTLRGWHWDVSTLAIGRQRAPFNPMGGDILLGFFRLPENLVDRMPYMSEHTSQTTQLLYCTCQTSNLAPQKMCKAIHAAHDIYNMQSMRSNWLESHQTLEDAQSKWKQHGLNETPIGLVVHTHVSEMLFDISMCHRWQ